MTDPKDGDSTTSGETIIPFPWSSRASSIPYLPGGSSRQIEALRKLLSELERVDGLMNAEINIGDDVARKLRDIVKNVTATGLVVMVDRSRCEVSFETRNWLESAEPFHLVALFHRNVRYFGELLHDLAHEPMTLKVLLESAQTNYDLPWTTVDQVRRRTSWLISLGYVEYCTSTNVRLTEEGRRIYEKLSPGGPDLRVEVPQAWTEIDVQRPHGELANLLEGLDSTALAQRNPVLGYIPRGTGDIDIVNALHVLVNATSPQITRADLLAFTKSKFEVSESSFGAVLTTLTRSGLIEQTALNAYSPTPVGSEWIENPTAESLILILHCKYQFILEILPLLSEFDKAPSLARAAHQHFALPRVDVGGIRTRLQLLKAAGLVHEYSNWKYQPTAVGEAFIHTYPLQEPADAEARGGQPLVNTSLTERLSDPDRYSRIASLLNELKDSATDSDSPTRLEKAVADSFSFLGFEARHVGGGGNTDVLATATDATGNEVRIIVDAKSARSGTVTENAVSFDTLREHKKKNQADFVVLIGPNFNAGRTRKRAEEHGVRLLTVEELSAILIRHSKVPQSAFAYLKLVDPQPDAISELESKWLRLERKLSLLGHVSAVLAQETREGDQTTGGALTADQIYLIIRDEIDPRPAAKDIEEVVQLLEHPLIGSVVRSSAGNRNPSYRLIDSPKRVVEKLQAIVNTIEQIELED